MAPQQLLRSIPSDIPPYESDAWSERVKLRSLSYDLNPRNLESPVYALSDKTLTGLLHPFRHLVDNWPQATLSLPKRKFIRMTQDLYDEAAKKQPFIPGRPKYDLRTRSFELEELEDANAGIEAGHELSTEQQNAGSSSGKQLSQTNSQQPLVAKNESRGALDDGSDLEDATDEDDDDDNFSIASGASRAEDKNVTDIVDFAWAYRIEFDMQKPSQQLMPRPTVGAESDAAAKARRYAAAHKLYKGLFLIYDGLIFIEEDKGILLGVITYLAARMN